MKRHDVTRCIRCDRVRTPPPGQHGETYELCRACQLKAMSPEQRARALEFDRQRKANGVQQ